MEAPGNLFIREKVGDINSFQAAFQGQRSSLKGHGFLAYSLHRDLADSSFLILTLKCSNLNEALAFVDSADFTASMNKAGVENPVIWDGLDVAGRKYANQDKMSGGIVIAHNEVRSYDFWKSCFDAEGLHHHPGRSYQPSNYSIHYLPGKPEVALVVHEASNPTKAPAFMTSSAMKGVMEASGVTGIEIWYGVNIEEGVF
jgi:hypothetical protein